MAIGTTIGFILAAATVLPAMMRLDYGFRFNFHWRKDSYLRSMGSGFIPILIAMVLETNHGLF